MCTEGRRGPGSRGVAVQVVRPAPTPATSGSTRPGPPHLTAPAQIPTRSAITYPINDSRFVWTCIAPVTDIEAAGWWRGSK